MLHFTGETSFSSRFFFNISEISANIKNPTKYKSSESQIYRFYDKKVVTCHPLCHNLEMWELLVILVIEIFKMAVLYLEFFQAYWYICIQQTWVELKDTTTVRGPARKILEFRVSRLTLKVVSTTFLVVCFFKSKREYF